MRCYSIEEFAEKIGKVKDKSDIELSKFSVGVDLGIKQLAITNIDDLETRNINKTSKVKKIKKKLKIAKTMFSKI